MRPILKQDAPLRYTLGVVYEPDVVDAQGDYAKVRDIEKACWAFMRKLQGRSRLDKFAAEMLEALVKTLEVDASVRLDVTEIWDDVRKAVTGLNDMHGEEAGDYGDIVECYVAPADLVIEGERVRKGTWLLGVVWREDYFAKVLAGERTGLSMGGRGKRLLEEAMEGLPHAA